MSQVDYKVNVSESGSGRLIAGIAIGCGCSLLMALGLAAVVAVLCFGMTSVKVNRSISHPPPRLPISTESFVPVEHTHEAVETNEMVIFPAVTE